MALFRNGDYQGALGALKEALIQIDASPADKKTLGNAIKRASILIGKCELNLHEKTLAQKTLPEQKKEAPAPQPVKNPEEEKQEEVP